MQGTALLARCFSSVNIFQQADFNFSGAARHFTLPYLTPSPEKFGNGLNRRMNVLIRHYTQKGLEMVAESFYNFFLQRNPVNDSVDQAVVVLTAV